MCELIKIAVTENTLDDKLSSIKQDSVLVINIVKPPI